MNNFWDANEIFFCFLYRKIADIERNWSVADESTNVTDSQYASDAQLIASITTFTTATTTTVPTTTTTSRNDADRNENVENSGDVSSMTELSQDDALRSGLINSIDSSDNA